MAVNPDTLETVLLELLAPLEDSDGIRVFARHEDPPYGEADDDTDEPDSQWCRVATIETPELPHRSAGDPGHYQVVAVITVGVSSTQNDTDARKVVLNAVKVAEALEGTQTTEDDHTVTIHRAVATELPGNAQHPRHRLYAVTATGRVEIF